MRSHSADPDDLSKGFMFRGRITEDFKLSTGTWVRVGTVRARLLAALGEIAQDVVITGHERDRVGVLVFPNAAACRAIAAAHAAWTLRWSSAPSAVRQTFIARLTAYNETCTGSSTIVWRALLLDTPPSFEHGEITDKGSINQRAVVGRRAALIDALYQAGGEDLLVDLESC